jgi:hypothetical protein
MANAASIGKTLFLSLLLIGAAAGFAASKTRAATPVGEHVRCTGPTGTAQEVNIGVDQGKITVDHDPVVVRVDECEQFVWKFNTGEINHLTVLTWWERKADPRARNPETGQPTPLGLPGSQAPPNPFLGGIFTGGGGAVVFSATSTTGTLASGRANPNTPGHEYKFTIIVTKSDGQTLSMDPHGRFD